MEVEKDSERIVWQAINIRRGNTFSMTFFTSEVLVGSSCLPSSRLISLLSSPHLASLYLLLATISSFLSTTFQ